MNSNKFVGCGLIATIVLAFFIQFTIVPLGAGISDGWFTFDGLGMMVFGIWGGIKLLKLK